MIEISKFYIKQNLRLGFAPTMGCLHDGHLSLLEHLNRRCDARVASIFVNPKQFCPGEDFERYPRDEERDLKLLKKNCDYVFIPYEKEMYPKGFSTSVEVSGLSDTLCGKKRMGHFKGVTTVVARLFGIVRPTFAAFGQKDYQQFVIIKKMTQDLSFGIQLIMCPTVREKDGLAMSSRNMYLSSEERARALSLRKALLTAKKEIEIGQTKAENLKKTMLKVMNNLGAKAEYAEIVDTENLQTVDPIHGEVLLAVAAYVGKTRLIDNEILRCKEL